MGKEQRYNIYVIELDRAVLDEPKFIEANPGHNPEKACLYVGMTGLNPDERFKKHKAGHKSNKYVRKYGLWLRRRLYKKYNPMTYEEAQRMEVWLAERLRAKGHAVWQG